MTKHNKLPVLWFFLGFGIFMFSRASRVIPFIIPSGIAMIIAPIFILGFIRSQTTKRGILLTFLGFLLSLNIALWGLFDVGNEFSSMLYNLVRSSVLAILFSFPYVMDRIMYPKFKEKGILSTLPFPIIATATFFLISLEGPFDGDMISAVFGYGHRYFKQIASVAGLWGFVWIFSWFASVINYHWEQKFHRGKIKNVTFLFTSVLLIILVFGAMKTSSLIRPGSDTVKIASIILLPEEGKAVDPEGLFNKEPSPFEETLSHIETLTKKAASHHANIVTLQETAIRIREEDETKLMNHLQEIAKKHDVYFSVGYGVYPEEGKGWNKTVLINKQGEMEIEYRKRYLLGLGNLFGETLLYKKGPEAIQTTDTPYGRIGVSICRDMSFPPYARQAGQKNVDIMLNPSYDVPKSTGPLYSLRAIENGFSMVRPVYNGFSFAVDYNGKILAEMDSDNTEDGIMYANVPTKGIKTIYSIIGDLLGWLCVLGFVAFVVMSIMGRVHKKHN
jgi:apolipoprotein N-acyltransferase